NNRGLARAASGLLDLAIADFSEAIRLDPQLAAAYNNRGFVYRDLGRQGVELLFQSFHNARRAQADHDAYNIWQQIVPATMMCRAATNHFWISATNSMARCSSWPSFVVAPDGSLVDQLPEHTDAVLISQVDQDQGYWDASAPWRDRSVNGQLYSGTAIDHPRSTDRTCL
ncbi:MAG: tetratricopeptide repeat protein, partial [Pirellulaceae bacterium]|nr:tetratricopeptide repeat protein [Pirellulaceae bacterium]